MTLYLDPTAVAQSISRNSLSVTCNPEDKAGGQIHDGDALWYSYP